MSDADIQRPNPSPAAAYLPQGHPVHAATLRRLLSERGIVDYALFAVCGEGRTMPNGEEERSGSVVLPDGRIFDFWIAWDDEIRSPTFTWWLERGPDDMVDYPELRRARSALDLGEGGRS